MANLPETETYDAGVYQLEVTDPVIGGADGKSNASARNLANRTKWLKARVDEFATALSNTIALKLGIQENTYLCANATGTTTAYLGDYNPDITALVDDMVLQLDTVSVGTNTTTTPSFSANGLTAGTIVKQNGAALLLGDMPNHALLKRDQANTRWLLLNPVFGNGGITASNIQTITGTGNLTNISGGLVLLSTTTTLTATLPAANTVGAGCEVQFMSINTGTATVQRAGSDTIKINSGTVNSLALGNGDSLTLVSNGSNQWYAITGTVQLKSSNTFKNGSGYSVFPDGTIIQRGTIAISVGQAAASVTFPIAFTSSVESITLGDNAASSAGIQYQGVGSPTTSGFTMWTNNTNGDTPYWIAIGK